MPARIADRSADAQALEKLLAQVGLGNQNAFAEIYKVCSAKLFSVVLRILRDQALAEEVLQDGFVRIWHHASGYRSAASAPMTWMTTIMRNAALDVVRRKSHEDSVDEDGSLDMFESDAPMPEHSVQMTSSALALENCLETLPATQRQTLVLAFFHGLSHSELADHLRQPIGTIKTWTRRGMERLKGCLETK
jgi:RNA polymerase sigma-70 factor (ECF subfamily)